jgi:pyruvyl transferase EpsO
MSGIAGFVSVILLVRYMDVAAYAAYTTLVGLIMMASVLSSLGLQRAATRYVPEGRLNQSAALLARFLWLTSLARLVAAALLTVVIGLLWQFLDDSVFSKVPMGAFTWAIACYLMATTLFQYLSTVMQALVLQKMLTRILAIQWGGRLVLILVLVVIHSEVTLDQALWIMAVPEMAGVAILAWALHRYLAALSQHQNETSASMTAPWPVWPEVRQMALHNYGYGLLAVPPQGYFMRMLAAVFLPVPFVAAYGFFLSLVDRIRGYLPLRLMYGMAEPVLIAGYVKDNDFEKLCLRAQFLFKANLIFLALLLAWLAVVAPEITSLLTGGKFAEYAWLILVIVAQMAVGSHAVTSQLILNAVGQSHILLKSGIFSLLAMGAALALVASSGHWQYTVFCPLIYSTANNAFIVWSLRGHRYAYRFPWADISKIAASGIVAYVAILVVIDIANSSLERIVIAGSMGLIVYLIALGLFGAVGAEDRQIMRSMLQRGSPA